MDPTDDKANDNRCQIQTKTTETLPPFSNLIVQERETPLLDYKLKRIRLKFLPKRVHSRRRDLLDWCPVGTPLVPRWCPVGTPSVPTGTLECLQPHHFPIWNVNHKFKMKTESRFRPCRLLVIPRLKFAVLLFCLFCLFVCLFLLVLVKRRRRRRAKKKSNFEFKDIKRSK